MKEDCSQRQHINATIKFSAMRKVFILQFLGTMASCIFSYYYLHVKEENRDAGEGPSVYSCYNESDNWS